MTPLVTTEWLAARLSRPEIKLLDASWHLPGGGRDAQAEFAAAHLPGAGFFDLEGVSDPDHPLPHMLPAPEYFSTAMRLLGLNSGDSIVVYDSGGVHAAARAWWMLRIFGHSSVAVLDGGLEKWRAEDRPLESGSGNNHPGDFTASAVNGHMMARSEDVKLALGNGSAVILDARAPGRFSGAEKEPRAGLRPGHMPGAKNLYYADLYGDDGCMKDSDALKRLFAGAGVDPAAPVITSCGSGVTACVLSLAMLHFGNQDSRVYDGSWVEWGGRQDTPVATGPA
jgi:thiosulfate/3-mercaptopyruvate sulfurtransferase